MVFGLKTNERYIVFGGLVDLARAKRGNHNPPKQEFYESIGFAQGWGIDKLNLWQFHLGK